ncbi:hypothetical protein V7S43_000266 [Phytophthora oleae]|uniref:Peroxin-14 n=1 Tax=Phytophthora oleae TaxID=2107226 RepID=A0ABD3G6V5_9STRA
MKLSSLRINPHGMQHFQVLQLRSTVCMLLFLLSETRRVLISASPSAKVAKMRMEIREQDFSFQDGARERPVIEVVTKDVRTADIFNIMQAAGEEEVAPEEGASWWKDTVTEEFTRQDVLVLALIALCILRLLQVMWKLVKLPKQWFDAMERKVEEEFETESMSKCSEETATRLRKQLTTVRFCHLQFLLVIEKLKREMRDDKNEDTQQMVASLPVSQPKEGKSMALSEILATLHTIQAKDRSFQRSKVEEHLADIKHNVEDEEDIDSGLSEEWERLQEIYSSFLRVQETIIRRQKCKKRQWQMQQPPQSHEERPRRRQRRFPSEDPVDDVLQELQELTKELPQGFTADMFKSLGNAMQEKMTAVEPATSPSPPPQLEKKTQSTAKVDHISTAAKYTATA